MLANYPGNPVVNFRINSDKENFVTSLLSMLHSTEDYIVMYISSKYDLVKILAKEKVYKGNHWGFGHFINIRLKQEMTDLVQVNMEISKAVDFIEDEQEYENAQDEMLAFLKNVKQAANASIEEVA